MNLRRVFLLLMLATMAAAAMACGDDDDNSSPTAADGGASPTLAAGATTAPTVASLPDGTITVFAASSLTDSFNEIGTAFEAAHAGLKVEFNFAGSPALVTQIDQGAPADMLATADTTNMQSALDKSLVVDAGETFAKNGLAIIVPNDNPGGIATPSDLAKPGLKIVLAQADVPVGKYARQALTSMSANATFGADFSGKVIANVVSEAPNVKAVVTAVQLGEADAGIVYVTDVTPGVASDVNLIAIPDAYNVIASYPIAVTKDASRADAAQAFIDFVRSSEGQAILAKYGFLPPE